MPDQYEARDTAHDLWSHRQDFTLLNRRQTARLGFIAGWAARKVHELKIAMNIGDLRNVFGKSSMQQAHEELREGEVMMATIEGRNWFRDSRGKIWVDLPEGITSFVAPDEVRRKERQARREREAQARREQADKAKEFLSWILKHGPRDGKVVVVAARDVGILPSALCRAREDMGIELTRTGFGIDSRVYWCLPKTNLDE